MTREYRTVDQGASQVSTHTAERAAGKQTQVMAAGGSPQVQGQTDPKPHGSAEPAPPDPVYQYAAGTTHLNDCGPASLLAVLRMLNAEGRLTSWILAHRPEDPDKLAAYQQHYPSAAPGVVDPQEALDVARLCVNTPSAAALLADDYRLGVPQKERDEVLRVDHLRNGLVCLLHVIGAQVPADLDAAAMFPMASEGDDDLRGVDASTSRSKQDLLRYLYRHCAGDQAVVLLGSPTSNQIVDGHTAEVPAWEWGGDRPTAPGGREVGIDPGIGHFVIVHSFNRGTKMFTLLDPSFAVPQQVTQDQLVEFITNRGANLANMLTVPLATVRTWMPAAQAGPATA